MTGNWSRFKKMLMQFLSLSLSLLTFSSAVAMDPRSYVVTGETNISWSGEDEAHKVATQVVVVQLIHFFSPGV